MPDSRADRTAYLGLLALMVLSADSENWSFPYWNALQIDAALNGLAQAVRDGTVPLVAPIAEPTVVVSTTPGVIPGSVGLEIAQTYVDAFGRETAASAIATITTDAGIEDPDTAATLGTPTIGGFSGYEGGLLEVWYSWTDAASGESLPSPVVQVEVPYQTGGLLSEVEVTLPSTPAVAGAAGANIYIRHRGGNVVLAVRIVVDATDTATLDGTVADCYRGAPFVNSTGSINAIDITGEDGYSGLVEGAVLARFYIRETGAAWTSGDRRLTLGGLDEWDPATVTYPLIYTGAIGELTAGFPPTVSQVKALRPIDLTTEVTGVLPAANMDGGGGGGGGTALTEKVLNRELCGLLELAELADALPGRVADSVFLETFKTAANTYDGVATGMVATTDASLDLPISAGSAVVDREEAAYGGGVHTVPDDAETKVWWDGAAIVHGAAWPGTAHAKICIAVSASGVITGVDDYRLGYGQGNTALDTANGRLVCPVESGAWWTGTTIDVAAGLKSLVTAWRVTQQPETGATITVKVDYDGGGFFGTLVNGAFETWLLANYVDPGPLTVAFQVRIENTDPSTEVWIEDFGAIWEETPA